MSLKRNGRSGAKRHKKIVTPYKHKNDKPSLIHRFCVFMAGLMIRAVLQALIKPFIPEPLLSMFDGLVEQFLDKL
ncbi:MAG: hypothetical protein ACRCYJ_01695 [Plesiomonas shigelloides]